MNVRISWPCPAILNVPSAQRYIDVSPCFGKRDFCVKASEISFSDASKICSALNVCCEEISPSTFSPHTTHSQRLISDLRSTRLELPMIFAEFAKTPERRGVVEELFRHE